MLLSSREFGSMLTSTTFSKKGMKMHEQLLILLANNSLDKKHNEDWEELQKLTYLVIYEELSKKDPDFKISKQEYAYCLLNSLLNLLQVEEAQNLDSTPKTGELFGSNMFTGSITKS